MADGHEVVKPARYMLHWVKFRGATMMTNSEEPGNRVKTQVLSQMGFVHLMKFQQLYKIRRSNATGRRKRELAIQLPHKTKMVHTIKTDDPVEIERFLHQRFKNKRGNGEWFKLDHTDVAAFKKRKFM